MKHEADFYPVYVTLNLLVTLSQLFYNKHVILVIDWNCKDIKISCHSEVSISSPNIRVIPVICSSSLLNTSTQRDCNYPKC